MDPAIERFLIYLGAFWGCILLAIGINKTIFRIGDAVSDWWTMRKVRKQAKAER